MIPHRLKDQRRDAFAEDRPRVAARGAVDEITGIGEARHAMRRRPDLGAELASARLRDAAVGEHRLGGVAQAVERGPARLDRRGVAERAHVAEHGAVEARLTAREIEVSLAHPLTIGNIEAAKYLSVSSKSILNNRKCAFVVFRNIELGLVRAWENMVEWSGGIGLETKIFKQKEEALEWATGKPIEDNQ